MSHRFLCRVAGEADTEFFENLVVDFAKHYCGVYLAAVSLGQAFKRASAVAVVGAEHGECYKHLVGMQSRIVASQVVYLCILYGLDHVLWDKLYGMVYAGQVFHCIKN